MYLFLYRLKMVLFAPLWIPLTVYSMICSEIGINCRWMLCVEVCWLRKRLGYSDLIRDYKAGEWEWYDWNSNFICCDVLKRYWEWVEVRAKGLN